MDFRLEYIRVSRFVRRFSEFVFFVRFSLCLAVAAVTPAVGRAAESLRLYDTNLDQAGYATPGVELPQQWKSVKVGEPCESYMLPGDPNQPVVIDDNVLVPNNAPPDPLLGGFRNKAIQRIEFDASFLPRRGRDDGVGFTDLDANATVAIPFPILIDESAFLITPDGQAHFVDGPNAPDLPPRLFDGSLQVAWVGKLPGNFVYDLAIQPGWHYDGVNTSNTAFRLPFYFAAGYRVAPNFLIGAGAAYLDRVDLHWVPLVGLLWVPEPNTRLELIPPRPRLAHRFWIGNGFERWWYFAAEFGGGEWAVRRASGANDVVDIQDWRVINGMEQIPTNGGLGFRVEYGVVFSRHVSYASDTPSFDPPSTLLARLGVIY
jgi:hypothetical protein